MYIDHEVKTIIYLTLPWWNLADDELNYLSMQVYSPNTRVDRKKIRRMIRRTYKKTFGIQPHPDVLERVYRRRHVTKPMEAHRVYDAIIADAIKQNKEGADTTSESDPTGKQQLEMFALSEVFEERSAEGYLSGSLPQTGTYPERPVPELQQYRGEDIQPSQPEQAGLFCRSVCDEPRSILDETQ